MDEVKSVQPRSTSEKHVLIVDDDRDMREMLSDCLRNNCFHATVVGDGTQARRQALRNKIDLAVVDLNLGREDGLNVVRDLAAQGIPVIIVTGNRVDEADKVVGLEIGAVDYLTKPFGVREFLARVRSKLRRRNDKGSNSRRRAYRFRGLPVRFAQTPALPRRCRRDSAFGWRIQSPDRISGVRPNSRCRVNTCSTRAECTERSC